MLHIAVNQRLKHCITKQSSMLGTVPVKSHTFDWKLETKQHLIKLTAAETYVNSTEFVSRFQRTISARLKPSINWNRQCTPLTSLKLNKHH